jgi:ABC-2 type transport system permease protein
VGLLFGLSSLSFGLADVFASGFDYPWFGPNMLRQGQFDQVLVRPVSPFLQVMASQLVLRRAGRLLQGGLVLALSLAALELTWTPVQTAFAGLTVLGGALLYFGLYVLGAAASFWTLQSLEVFNTLTYGGQMLASYPLDVFGPWLRRFFTFVVPVAFVCYFPALWLLGKPDPHGLPDWLAFLAAPLCALASLACLGAWRLGVRHYQSSGS